MTCMYTDSMYMYQSMVMEIKTTLRLVENNASGILMPNYACTLIFFFFFVFMLL